MASLLTLDGNLLLWIQEAVRIPILSPFFIFITHLGDSGMIWIAITLILLAFKRTRRIGLMALLALIGSLVVNNMILKNLIARTRPYEVIAGLEILVEAQKDLSFPSGHAGSSFAAATVYLRNMDKKTGVPLFILAILIALSRLYVGVHYPSDVLAGTIIGILLGILAEKLVKRIENSKEKKEKEDGI